MVPLQRQPDSTSSKTTWQYLFKDNLTVPLQRQPDSTSPKTTWQYLSKDDLTVPLQRQPDSTSSKTTWQYLSKDNSALNKPNNNGKKQTCLLCWYLACLLILVITLTMVQLHESECVHQALVSVCSVARFARCTTHSMIQTATKWHDWYATTRVTRGQ